MIELLETPTFVVDDLFDTKYLRLLEYLEYEKIPCEILELCSAELQYREGAYYPIVINSIGDEYELFKDINPRALQMAQDQDLIIVFIYTGHKNFILSLKDTLIGQLVAHDLTLEDIRIISEVKPIIPAPSYVYFSFAEMEAYLDAQESDYVDGFVESQRDNVFTCNIVNDSAHARLFCASMWYHALTDFSYVNYPPAVTTDEVIKSPIYEWNKHWSSTDTLIDMFGQQLPVVNEAGYCLDYYNNAYWSFSTMPSFSSIEVSLSKNAFLPILNLQPFVIVGPSGSMDLLNQLGYKTFRKHVNESYDTIIDDEARMQGLFRLVYEMSHFTGDELNMLNDKLRSIVVHNQAHFLSSKKYRLITLLNNLKLGSF